MLRDKGINPFISIVFVILFGIVMITVTFLVLGKVEREASARAVEDQLTLTARELGAEIVNIYQSVKDFSAVPSDNSTLLVREISVRLPDRVGNRNYQLDLEEPQNVLLALSEFLIDGGDVNASANRPTARIVATSDGVTVSQKIFNVDIGLQGSTKGGVTQMRGYKYNYNGEVRDKVVIGDDKIIVSITNLASNQTDVGCSPEAEITVEGFAIYTKGGVVTGTASASISETRDGDDSAVNPEFSISFCSNLENQTEYTALVRVVDSNGDSGVVRKKLLG